MQGKSLSLSEQTWWEANLGRLEIQEQLKLVQGLQKALALENEDLLKQQLQSWDKESTASVPRKLGRTRSLPRIVLVAASLALLLVSLFWVFQKQNPDLIAQYFEPYPSILDPVLKGENQTTSREMTAMQAYQNKDYVQALKYFEGLEKSNDTLSFYRANTLLALGQYPQAQSAFTSLGDHQNRFQKEARWFEALSLLGMERSSDAKAKLLVLSGEAAHPYQHEAEEILRKME